MTTGAFCQTLRKAIDKEGVKFIRPLGFGLLLMCNSCCFSSFVCCRVPDWNIQTDDGLCSWPSTPLHDVTCTEVHQSSPVTKGKQELRSKGAVTAVQRQNGFATERWRSSSGDCGQVFKWGQGERLVL